MERAVCNRLHIMEDGPRLCYRYFRTVPEYAKLPKGPSPLKGKRKSRGVRGSFVRGKLFFILCSFSVFRFLL